MEIKRQIESILRQTDSAARQLTYTIVANDNIATLTAPALVLRLANQGIMAKVSNDLDPSDEAIIRWHCSIGEGSTIGAQKGYEASCFTDLSSPEHLQVNVRGMAPVISFEKAVAAKVRRELIQSPPNRLNGG
jgi:hypothetical protein